MTKAEKLTNIKVLLGINDTASDTLLETYIDLSTQEILAWLYTNVGEVPTDVTDVPYKYEIVQINSVVEGFTHAGAEGEKTHNENGINRIFKYEDMVAYIRSKVFPYVGV